MGAAQSQETGNPQHGGSEQWFGAFGLTPPGSRAPTPGRSARTMRTPSPRRSPRRDSPEERERSREDRSPRSDRGEEQPLPTTWGARTLSAEVNIQYPSRKFNTFLNAIQAVMAALVHRLEATTGFFDGRTIQLENIIPERSHRSEERQELYIRMLNKLKQNINIRFTDI